MKRSEINALMRQSVEFMQAQHFHLPPFAFWSPEDWQGKGAEADEIRDCMLGWDLTDFGLGEFHQTGLILFTIRNGHPTDTAYAKRYCEKIMIVEEEQITPMHFHWQKSEDIINRGGGNLLVQLYHATPDEQLADSDVSVAIDGVRRTLKAGDTVRLAPGESIALVDHVYHSFWGEPGKGTCLIGEVSAVNDDAQDNRFLDNLGRFPQVEEDEPPLYPLCSEYPRRQAPAARRDGNE